jgi:hypothetical protein
MNLLTRYLRSIIGLLFGVLFLVVAGPFSHATYAAPFGAGGTSTTSILEVVNGIPAVTFCVAGTGLIVWAVIYAIALTPRPLR